MKHFLLTLLVLSSLVLFSQVPSNYYNSANGLTGYALKTQLSSIISNSHNPHSYSQLYTAYQTSDTDNYFENDGTVLDMYSEKPNGSDSYNYNHTNSDHCGNYNSEADCYNREHIMPQSVFSSASPMKADAHFVVPSDGYVNGQRGSLPFGEVQSASWTSTNGSKRGSSATAGYSGQVFEPIDEFKGDIARMLLYFATRYESQVVNWNHTMLNGTSNQVYSDWFIALLLDWHTNDPVSQREIDRNNALYNYQTNANPFIDHPEWVNTIWNPSAHVNNAEFADNLLVYPNPAKNRIQIKSSTTLSNIVFYNALGQIVLSQNDSNDIDISSLEQGVYICKIIDEFGNVGMKKIIKN
ncbi:MAG: endonuclease [Flavobacteriaceae bacterium]